MQEKMRVKRKRKSREISVAKNKICTIMTKIYKSEVVPQSVFPFFITLGKDNIWKLIIKAIARR